MRSQVMACLDLLLRWCVLRVVESNTQSLVKVTDMLKAIMEAMTQADVRWVCLVCPMGRQPCFFVPP